MARFPRVEPEIASLAREIAVGLANNPAIFPSPPVSAADLEAALAAYTNACAAVVATQAAAQQATTDKNAALQNLVRKMKTDIHYAESAVSGNGPALGLLGWDARRPKSRLRAPGQVLELETRHEGPGWIALAWRKPVDGGAPRVYRIQRRLNTEARWHDAEVALTTELTLTDQERGKEWEYRVVAMNRAGEGDPSNTVTAVL